MKEINVTVGQWYVVEGAAGDTITNPSTGLIIATVEDGKQAVFYATAAQVVASSDSVKVHRVTFNSAPAKLMALGLLGGGDSLTAGYLAAEFLESTGTASLTVPLQAKGTDELTVETEHMTTGVGSRYEGMAQTWCMGVYNSSSYLSIYGGAWKAKGSLKRNAWNKHKITADNGTLTIFSPSGNSVEQNLSLLSVSYYALFADKTQSSPWVGRKRSWKAIVNSKTAFDLRPALTPLGIPCMYCGITQQAFTNTGTGSFIVGLTLTQARKLGKLPATGGTLSISLPVGYESDAGVVNALETARGNGWTLTIQTYEPEDATASTYALRRVWVRRTQDENGTYVDAEGTRWQVEWCVDMLTPDGSTPDAHGYELYRSTEAAVEYWGLEPWVDPNAEQEELLIDDTTNE